MQVDLEKFKQLSLKKKIQWLLQYYGLTALIAVLAIAVISIFLKSVFCPEPISDICVLILDESISYEDTENIAGELEQITGKSVDVVSYGKTDIYGKEAFAIKLTSDQLDIVLAPYEETMQMLEAGYLTDQQALNNTKLYLGIPRNARTGEALDQTIDYFKNNFGK